MSIIRLPVHETPFAKPSKKNRIARVTRPSLHGWKPVATPPTTSPDATQMLFTLGHRWHKAPPSNDPTRNPTPLATRARDISSKSAEIRSLRNVNVGPDISANIPWNNNNNGYDNTLIKMTTVETDHEVDLTISNIIVVVTISKAFRKRQYPSAPRSVNA